jgi:thiamine-phosphate pyrophosphorylase
MPLARFLAMPEVQKAMFTTRGASVHSVEDAILAQKSGATYLTAGHIFATDCKKGVPPRGLLFLREVCTAVSIPVYAIGGIHKENAVMCIEQGAAGVCMMSEYMRLGD